MDPPKFIVGEVTDQENGLRRVQLRLADDTLKMLTEVHPHGNLSSMTATVTLPPQMLPFAPGQSCGFAITETP